MAQWTLPASLPSLNTRDAIIDPLYRSVLGLDTADQALFDSAFTEDAVFDLNGNLMTGLKAIRTGCFDGIAKLDTTHFLNNIRVQYTEGASTASVTCSALAQHYREGQGMVPDTSRLLSGGLYFFDLVRDDKVRLWKIKHWRMKLVWTEGDFGIVMGN